MNQATKVQAKFQKHLNQLIAENFLLFLLERWKISSGESLGVPYSFADRAYLLEIARDDFPFVVIMKAAQAGLSEIQIARAIWRAIYCKRNVLYTMPAGEQMQQFVDARARNAVLENEELSRFVTGSLNLKKFSLNHHQIYFRGVQKRRQMITVDVSDLFADECDEYEEGTLYTLDKRLGASKDPHRVYFSTPRFHSSGISLYYYGSEVQGERGSDQRVWSIKCERCGQWNEDLTWEENVIDLNESTSKFSHYEPDVIVVCRHCRKPIDRLTSNGEWVAKFPSNGGYCHGYHVSKLFSPLADLNKMMLDSKNPLKEQEFRNSDLGIPYEPQGSRLTDDILDRVRGSHSTVLRITDSKTRCIAGVDVGSKLHFIALTQGDEGKLKLLTALELDDWDDLHLAYRDFNVSNMVIDANPDKNGAKKFQEEHEGVWLAYYMQHLENKPDKYTLNYDDQVIYIHRTLMMQITSDFITDKNLILPIDIRKVRGFYEQMKAPVKAQKQNLKGDWLTFYPRTSMPDHFYHALLYSLVADMLKPKVAGFRLVKTFF